MAKRKRKEKPKPKLPCVEEVVAGAEDAALAARSPWLQSSKTWSENQAKFSGVEASVVLIKF